MKLFSKFIPSLFYISAGIILTIWWGLAFRCDPICIHSNSTASGSIKIDEFDYLSTIDRDRLKSSLQGNPLEMAAFIHDWDVDAQWLESIQIKDIKRLKPHEILKSQLLARKLVKYPSQFNELKLLPQTYVSANFLLAMVKPSQIMALPKGFREQQSIFYSPTQTDLIPLNIDRNNTEQWFLKNPNLAFIAHYSHPSTVEALRNQKIPLFTISKINTFEEICKEILEVGKAIEREDIAELLTIFMEGAMLSLDNRLSFIKSQKPLPKTLYVNYHAAFSFPTEKNLIGQLLVRMGIMDHKKELDKSRIQGRWSIPIEQEKIIHFKPECLIISSNNKEVMKKQIEKDSAFAGLKNACKHISYVDENVMQSPTQFVVLAYFDLLQALVN